MSGTASDSEHARAQRRSGVLPDRYLGYVLAATAAVLWATGAVTAKWMFDTLSLDVDPSVLSGARAVLAFAVTLVYLVLFRRAPLQARRRDLPFLAAFGVLGLAMVHFTYFKTISLTGVATAILLEYLAPILVLLISVAFLGERFTWALPAGVALSVAGTALMVGAAGGGRGLAVTPEGLAWGLASACFFALYTVMGKYASPRFSPWTLLVYGLGAASLFWIVVLGGPQRIWAVLTYPPSLAGALYVAVFSTVLPFAAFLTALHHIDATKASVTASLEPAVAGVIAYVVLGESLTPVQLLGGLLVLAAIITVQAPVARAREPRLPRAGGAPASEGEPEPGGELPPVG
jgi:drug/metabolite transporter (DMT)-like permease